MEIREDQPRWGMYRSLEIDGFYSFRLRALLRWCWHDLNQGSQNMHVRQSPIKLQRRRWLLCSYMSLAWLPASWRKWCSNEILIEHTWGVIQNQNVCACEMRLPAWCLSKKASNKYCRLFRRWKSMKSWIIRNTKCSESWITGKFSKTKTGLDIYISRTTFSRAKITGKPALLTRDSHP